MSVGLRPSRTLVLVLVALGVCCAAGIAYAFRRELRYGRVAPPEIHADALEPALARRLRERTAAVVAQPYSAETWGMLGLAYDAHDLFSDGLFCYERAEALDPQDFRWPYFMGVSMRLGDRAASLIHLRRAAELNARYAPLQYFIADGSLERGDLDSARATFQRALELEPNMVAAHLGLAKIALARSDATAALKHLNDALALRPLTGEVHSLFVEAYRLKGDDAAQQEHARLEGVQLGIEPVLDPLRDGCLWKERVTLQWRRARAEQYLKNGRNELALEEMRQAVSDAPESSQAQVGLGEALSRLDRQDEAIAAFERAVALAPDDASAQNNLGAAYARAGRFDVALAAFERAVQLDPSLHQAKNNLGMLLLQTGATERGFALIAESCKALPNDIGAHINWAMALKEANRLEEAAEVFRGVTEIDPSLVRAHFELGLALAQLGRPAEAVDEFRKVVAGEPTRASGHINLVRALLRTGRDAEGIAACREGLRVAPTETFFQLRLAWLLSTSADTKLRNGAEALEIVRPIVEQTHRQDPESLRVLATALAETGDFTGAAQCAREALELMQAHATAPGAGELIADLERGRALYEAGQSYRREP